MLTLTDLAHDGHAALTALIASSAYGTMSQLVASLTLFSHPETVAQTRCRPLFPIIRNFTRRGQVDTIEGRLIGFDDNTSPTLAFMWCNNIKRRGRDLQFNHVWSDSSNVECYCALPNLCITPSFIAKLTDTDPHIRALLRCRVLELYGWHPAGVERPVKPDGYDDLVWAEPLPAVADVRAVFMERLARTGNHVSRMTERTGHCFNGFRPHVTHPASLDRP